MALFFALAGGAYAATAIPQNSISNGMLKNNSVGFAKMRNSAIGYQQIKPGSVGTVRIDKAEIQQAIKSTCTTGQVISAITEAGKVTCSPSQPAEFDSGAGTAVALTSPTTGATVASYSLAAGSSYMVQADPYVSVTPGSSDTGADEVTVNCTLTAGTATETRSATVDVTGTGAAGAQTSYASIPLTVTTPSSASAQTATVACTSAPASGSAPTVKAQTTIYALQTASNTSAASTS